ncbi:replication endonuclease, partial [Vibrio rotiferianus]|uniref:replication endonuclease n=1 Tax=Vibrio rotiferianus TaxID=190895 RepID=UPI0002378159
MVKAQLTEYGSRIMGFPVGTVFSWEEAKELPPGDPSKGLFVAKWLFEKDEAVESHSEPVRVPVETNSRIKSRHSDFFDNQFDVTVPYVDHTRPTPPTPHVLSELERSINAIEFPRSKASRIRLTNWRKPVFDAVKRHGDFAPHMVRAFTNILEQKDYTTALSMIQEADERLRENGVRYARNDDEIVELAKAKAKAFARRLAASASKDDNERLDIASNLLAQVGLGLPPYLVKQAEKSGDIEPLLKRVSCEIWLRRQLRRAYFSRVESVARDLQLVNTKENPYCSSHSVQVIKSRQFANEQALINTVAYNEDDPEIWFTLQELAAKSISNPMIRRAEMFVRLKAFDEIAVESKHAANFLTVTAPSRFHV